MEEKEKHIELYPGHWLYNAGVIGFLQSLEKIEAKNVCKYLTNDGRVIIPSEIFNDLKSNERYFSDNKITSIYRNAFFRNYLNTEEDMKGFPVYLKSLVKITKGGVICGNCGSDHELPEKEISELRKIGLNKFLDRISNFNIIFSKEIAPSINEFPNAFWNMNNSLKLCPLCSFLLIHHQMPFTILADNSFLFINTPSFRLMYELNKLLERLASKENASYKNLLAMSVIEFSIKTTIMMNLWASMDIEMISIKRTKETVAIEFINLPYETIRILSNKRIAELLSSIGEFKILNIVIEGKWKNLIGLGYRILKIAMKSVIGKEDRNFIENYFFRYENRETQNLQLLANKLFKLYALIEERTKSKQNEFIY
jgi:CRISPR-associated protein Cst1